MKRKPIYLILLLLYSCTIVFSKDKAEEVVNKYYDLSKNKQYNEMLNYFTDSFFEVTSKKEYFLNIQLIKSKFGEITNIELKKWNVRRRNKEVRYYLIYEITYSSKYITKESFKLIQFNKNAEIKIYGHDIFQIK